MSPLAVILILLLLGLVVLVVGAPLRRRRRGAGGGASAGALGREAPAASPQRRPTREELEAAREAKYREIRDCELDYRTGKLSTADYEAIDAQLRAEAIAILNAIERRERGPAPQAQPPDGERPGAEPEVG